MFFGRRKKKAAPSLHFAAYKELARDIIAKRVAYFNERYGFSFGRIAIKNQKRCWGSCSAKKNLNFNYKVIFLPEPLMDYVIVHELCHLKELNHGSQFWNLVGEAVPDYKEKRAHLKRITSVPAGGFPSSVFVSLRQP